MAFHPYQETERFNWRRTIGLAATFALHAFAFMMLLAPVTPPQAKDKTKDNIVTVEFIPPPPPPAPVEAPPTPMSIPTPPAPPAPPPPPQDIAPSENISYRKMRPPRYPPIAIREHHSGKVVLKVLIGLDGSPKEVTVERSSGYRELDQAAIAAAKTWIFNPGTRNGKPYEGYALVPID